MSLFYMYGLFQAFQNATVDKFMTNCTTGVSHCVGFVSNHVCLQVFGSLSSLTFISRSLLIGVLFTLQSSSSAFKPAAFTVLQESSCTALKSEVLVQKCLKKKGWFFKDMYRCLFDIVVQKIPSSWITSPLSHQAKHFKGVVCFFL